MATPPNSPQHANFSADVSLRPPYFPIIYVRGYAMTSGEIAEAVSSPYMGFNLGSTKIRQTGDRKVQRHIFESPLIRLMKEYGYLDTYANGKENEGEIPARSLIIYRYYESADKDIGQHKVLSIIEAAQGLRELIYKIRDQVCAGNETMLKQFKVHLVAHSMGGLICRCFLQNDAVSSLADRELVSKVFTYAAPHNGIELANMNIPSLLGIWDLNNFSRKKMANYLGLRGSPERVDSLDGKFDPDRFFCFVGTNHRDFDGILGISRILAGEMSDGLVQIENATIQGAPRAFAYRSHSGPYGVVNSEEGYQNLVRFLFGDTRADGTLEVEKLPLPPTLQKALEKGRRVRASYYFEATVAVRGLFNVNLTERRRDTFSAVIRGFDELLRIDKVGLDQPRAPVLFSVFLDKNRITFGKTIVFSVDIAVSTTGYTLDKKLWLDRFIEGEYLFRHAITIKLTRNKTGLSARYTVIDERWSESTGTALEHDGEYFLIPLSSPKGFKGRLKLKVQDIRPA